MSGILFFSPHPDDVEFVLGGTVLLHCNQYCINIVVMTDGEAAANGTKEIRRFESENVAHMYPNIHYTYLGFNDMCIDSYNKEQVLSIIKIIRRLKPSIIIIPDSCDIHPDHYQTALLVKKGVEMAASYFDVKSCGTPFSCKFILSYGSPRQFNSNRDGKEYIYIDVSSIYEEKKKLIQIYESQIIFKEENVKTDINGQWFSLIEAIDRINGSKIGVCYAERLCLVKGSLGTNNLFKILF